MKFGEEVKWLKISDKLIFHLLIGFSTLFKFSQQIWKCHSEHNFCLNISLTGGKIYKKNRRYLYLEFLLKYLFIFLWKIFRHQSELGRMVDLRWALNIRKIKQEIQWLINRKIFTDGISGPGKFFISNKEISVDKIIVFLVTSWIRFLGSYQSNVAYV